MIRLKINDLEIRVNLAIAKHLGIEEITKKPDEDVWVGISADKVPSVVPLFTRDLNACDKAYRSLTPIQRLRFKEQLWKVHHKDGQPMSIGNMPIDANAWLRCKAFMSVIGESLSD